MNRDGTDKPIKIIQGWYKTMYLFIDTNIFLSFYHLSSDDLDELNKLGVLLQHGKINLLLTDQVTAEFRRNRANKIADALKRLREQRRLGVQYPQLCREYEEFERLREYQRDYEEHFGRLLEKIDKDVEEQNLKADLTIRDLFSVAAIVLTSPTVLQRARLRFDIGNPPGKNGSLGDAINWEAILDKVPVGVDLYFISDDKDFCSPLDDGLFDPFLLQEWRESKKSRLFFYKRLSGFLKEKFPAINLASEQEKDSLIRELANSWSFAQTHIVIGKLARYSDFSATQANEIVSATVTNNQVYWIIEDMDVKEFITNVISGREDRIDQDNLQRIRKILPKENSGADLPF
jgi:predicted nucleic acid-binding protein